MITLNQRKMIGFGETTPATLENNKMVLENCYRSIVRRGAASLMWVAMFVVGLPHLVEANDQIPGAPQKSPIAIVGATIHPVSGGTVENGILVFDQGKIVDYGRDVAIPAGTVQVSAAGMHVYPGLINAMTDLGLREIGAVDVTLDSQELGDINPNVRAWVAVNPDSELIPVTRANGILTALVAPQGGRISGQAAVMALDGWTTKDMVLRAPAGLCVRWERFEPFGGDLAQRARDREANLKALDELLDEASRYAEARAANPDKVPSNVRLDAMLPVIRGEMPLIAEADRQETIESAVLYAAKRGLKLVIVGGYDAEACVTLLKRYEVPVIITMTYRLPRYRHDPYDAPYTLPARLQAAGIKFAISGDPTDSSNIRNLPYNAANAVAYGLSEEEALRSVTQSAAEILGVGDLIGSLEKGKHATLVITDGDILESDTQVVDAYISGRKVDLSSRHTMLNDKYKQKYLQQKDGAAE